MPQERSEAIVLRGVDFSETSRIVTFLTPERGRMACMAAGARRAKSAVGGALDTFNRLELVYYWKEGRSVQKLAEATLLDGFSSLKSDLDKALYAAFPLEVAYRAAQEDEPSHELYAALVHGLEGMTAWAGDARTHAAWQVARLMAAAGFELDSPEHAGRPLRPEDAAVLMALIGSEEACPAVKDDGGVFSALRAYAQHHLETSFRSLRVIDQVFAGNQRQ